MKLDSYHITKLLGYIAQGLSKESTCFLAGISKSTFYKWYNEGKEHERQGDESLQRQLYDGVALAEAQCEQMRLRTFTNDTKGDWRASARYLEHTRPDLYANRKTHPEKGEKAEIRVIG
ncbi:MAG: hypothetical protein HKK67_04605 [Chlorobiaceae bacterium]|nr:hypothetical protein [Chlorobiaceae bacterium]